MQKMSRITSRIAPFVLLLLLPLALFLPGCRTALRHASGSQSALSFMAAKRDVKATVAPAKRVASAPVWLRSVAESPVGVPLLALVAVAIADLVTALRAGRGRASRRRGPPARRGAPSLAWVTTVALASALLPLFAPAKGAHAQAVYTPSQVRDIAGLSQAVTTTIRQPVASNCDFPSANSSNGSITSMTNRSPHYVFATATSIQLVYFNSYNADASTGDAAGDNDITVKAAVELTTSSIHPVFFGGKRTVTIEPGGMVISDPLEVSITAGTTIYDRTYTTLPGGSGTWPVDSNYGTATVSGADNADSGAAAVFNTTKYPVKPLILGVVPRRSPVIEATGDSIATGEGDTGPATAVDGYILRALYGSTTSGSAALLPWVRNSKPGDRFQGVSASEAARRYRMQMPMLARATHAICEYGVNDLRTGRALATVQAEAISYWRALAARNMLVFQCTITPVTSSTDLFITEGNQTFASSGASDTPRANFNAWIRDGAPVTSASNLTAVATGTVGALRAGEPGHPLAGYFDVDAAVSSGAGAKWGNGGNVTTGTATSATATTLVDTTKSFTTLFAGNAAASFVVEITGGTGSGQIRAVTNFSATSLTVATWTTNPDATSTYRVIKRYTADGIHPTTGGHIQAATAINLSRLILQ